VPSSFRPPRPVDVRLLGEFAVRYEGRPLPVRRGGQRLLAFLGLQPDPVPRSRVAFALWPVGTGGQALANLRAALSRLPKPAGLPLTTSQDAQLALSEHVEVDYRSCDARLESLRVAAPGVADEEWPGAPGERQLENDLLPAWDDDWITVERERFRQGRLHALERLSASLRRAGQLDRALQAALAAVAGEPLRESAHRRVVEVHLTEGNPAEALRQYEIYRSLLRTELGLRPSEAIRQLVRPLLGRPDDVDA
jgi:DNA-binding SARP family transcriptional activator